MNLVILTNLLKMDGGGGGIAGTGAGKFGLNRGDRWVFAVKVCSRWGYGGWDYWA